jgi:hypothetical protein
MTLKFNLSEDSYVAEEPKTSSRPTWAREGHHDFEIVEIGESRVDRGDPTWISVPLQLKTAAGYNFNMFLNLPTTKFTYTTKAGKETNVRLRMGLVPFLEALGITEDVNNPKTLSKYLVALFERGGIVGKRFSGVIGYGKNTVHVRRILKAGSNEAVFVLADHEGTPVTSDTFPDRDSAALQGRMLSDRGELPGRFVRFSEIVNFYKTNGVTNFPQQSASGLVSKFKRA